MYDSPGLVDFAMRLVNSVRPSEVFWEIKIT